MEDGLKGNNVSPTESKVIHKAGWLKKSSGLLGLWKDRYIQILQTQLQVFDNEEEQRCLETLELANYERCQDQKVFLKRKKHFNLIPSPGTKVQDVKFQAKNTEERDVWIQALNDGINRGKNKVFDEVKVDPKCSLEHVTRDRVKVGATKRRPPTRIHLKEVADASADDSLRLGLEALDTGILTVVPPIPKEKVEETIPQKEAVKIPMPPTKPSNLQTTEPSISETTDGNIQAPRVPSPPPKSLKENVYAREKLLSENAETNVENKSHEENVNNIVNTPPKPPPKILSDKMKIKWIGSNSDLMEKENVYVEKGSKENLVNFDSDDPEKTNPIEAMIPNDIDTKEGRTSSLEDDEKTETDDGNDDQNDDEDTKDEVSTERTSEDMEEEEEEHVLHENDSVTDDTQEPPTDPQVLLLDDTKRLSPRLLRERRDYEMPAEKHLIDQKPKASSMGDLLSDSTINIGSKEGSPVLHLRKHHLQKVEMKLACGRQRTETLLHHVLNGQHGAAKEGNKLDVDSATLLNEVMRDLQEASEALREMKGPKTTAPEADRQKEKELLALQRRTVHF
ncbi:hypothetical protein GDO81_009432 [Engystomops pustulosus]|uniref:PH domain-containing protein n=1 Tax=Engystomops pustulosus TaxID=76066 RepID=A0AAV7BR08_ENGPU|nr:hypothetical protein GDO81_009432 [Engystomops pustulosus]